MLLNCFLKGSLIIVITHICCLSPRLPQIQYIAQAPQWSCCEGICLECRRTRLKISVKSSHEQRFCILISILADARYYEVIAGTDELGVSIEVCEKASVICSFFQIWQWTVTSWCVQSLVVLAYSVEHTTSMVQGQGIQCWWPSAQSYWWKDKFAFFETHLALQRIHLPTVEKAEDSKSRADGTLLPWSVSHPGEKPLQNQTLLITRDRQ